MDLYLAPMDWYTDAAYRTICKNIFDKYNKIDSFSMVTEFMSADGFVRNPKWVLKHLLKTPIDSPLVAQIFWWNQETLLQTAESVDRDYADYAWVELNIWCPSPKIVSWWWGSWMLKNKKRTLEIVRQLSLLVKKQFSIKTRAWLNELDKQKQSEFILECAQYCDVITIHARTFSHWNVWPVDWDYVYNIKKIVWDSCKIIWNGWVGSYEMAKEKQWNLDWIMIWQACIWNPWIFCDYKPTIEQVCETILEHLALATCMEIYYASNPFEEKDEEVLLKMPTREQIDTMLNDLKLQKYDGNFFTVKEFRKHLFCYVKWLLGSKPFKQNIIWTTNYYWLVDEINRYFDEIKNRY